MQNGIIPPSRMLILLAWVFFLFSFSAWADFQDMQPAEKVYKPGVSLSFDDDFIELWHKARPIFKEHGARITFFICRYHALSAAKKEMLRDLQADGHEIAYHSVSHIDGKEYLKNHTLQEYLDNEIAPDLKLMNEDNFFPRTFAYPWGGFTPEMDIALKKKFLMLRKSGRLGGKDTILIPGQQKKDIAGASIDFSRFNQEAFDGVIEKIAKDQSGIAILYTHRITEARVPQSHIIIEDLVKLLQKIREKGLTFYTFSELAPEVAPGKELIYQSLEKGTVDKANLLMADSWPVDRFPDIYLPGGPTWNEDPYGEKYWRFLFYALRPLGNLIYGWKKTGDLKYLKKSREFIISFMENNALEKPPLTDPHTSAFLSMMLVSFGIKLEREGLFSPDQSALFLKGLRNRALFLSDDDNYEGDYNHGLTEALALFLIGEMYPYLASSEEWKTLALKRLALTIQGTVDTDGAEVEQSPFYHYYVLKFFWEIEKWAKQYSVDLPGLPLEDIIKLMMTFGGYMVQPDGLTPDMGSSTRFNLYEDRICKEMAPLNSFFTYVYTKGKKGEAPQQSSRLFSTAGFSVLRTPFQSSSFSDATHILFDVGPYRTNHSQLDALNFTFYASRPLLVDSGLFTYEKGEKHDYYAGTSAHNTIVVDGLDQKKGNAIPGKFLTNPLWSYQAGQHALYKGMIHKRGVLLLQRDVALVFDRVEVADAAAEHRFDCIWHLAPDLDLATVSPGVFTGKNSKGIDVLKIIPLTWESGSDQILKGATSPLQGWVSITYEKEVPAPVLKLSKKTTGGVSFVTLIVGGQSATSSEVTARLIDVSPSRFEVEVKSSRGVSKVILDNFMDADESVQVTP